MNLDDEFSYMMRSRAPAPSQNQTETNAFSSSLFEFKMPIFDLDEQVEDIRRRAEIILEKLLALPTPPKQQNSPPSQKPKKETPKAQVFKDIKNEENLPEKTNPPDQDFLPSPPQPVKKKGKAKTKGKKAKRKKSPVYIIPKKEPIVIPGANERYEQQLILLQQQLQRLNSENSRLQALIREYNIKLRESQIEQEKLKYMLKQSQQQRLHVDPLASQKPKAQ